MKPDVSNPPFAVPPDIVLDLPAPLSVNRTRRIDWQNYKHVKAWQREADGMFQMQKRGLPPAILGRYEIIITLSDVSVIDLDNSIKILVDTVRRFKLVTDDSPKFMRQVTIKFGDVEGSRVTVRPVE